MIVHLKHDEGSTKAYISDNGLSLLNVIQAGDMIPEDGIGFTIECQGAAGGPDMHTHPTVISVLITRSELAQLAVWAADFGLSDE